MTMMDAHEHRILFIMGSALLMLLLLTVPSDADAGTDQVAVGHPGQYSEQVDGHELWFCRVDGGYGVCGGLLTFADGACDVRIPSSLNTDGTPKPVTEIMSGSFRDSRITSVDVPGSVRTIWESAFEMCESLGTVHLSEGLTAIKGYAFNYCTALEEITIPSTVKSMGEMMFNQCRSLEDVVWPGIGLSADGVFPYCGIRSFTVLNDVPGTSMDVPLAIGDITVTSDMMSHAGPEGITVACSDVARSGLSVEVQKEIGFALLHLLSFGGIDGYDGKVSMRMNYNAEDYGTYDYVRPVIVSQDGQSCFEPEVTSRADGQAAFSFDFHPEQRMCYSAPSNGAPDHPQAAVFIFIAGTVLGLLYALIQRRR